MTGDEATVRLDLNKIRQLTWIQIYRDQDLKWEKISSIKPPSGIDAVYSLRNSRARRATAHRDTAHRDGDFIRFRTIAPYHDATDGQA